MYVFTTNACIQLKGDATDRTLGDQEKMMGAFHADVYNKCTRDAYQMKGWCCGWQPKPKSLVARLHCNKCEHEDAAHQLCFGGWGVRKTQGTM